MATYAHKREIEAGCLALRRGVWATTMRRFRCDVTISPEAEHQSWGWPLEEQVNYKQPPQGASHLSHLVSAGRYHAALFFTRWTARLHSGMCVDTIAYIRQGEP